MAVLFVTTSADALTPKSRTGLWLEELAVPYTRLREAGISIVVGSPKGGAVPIDPKTEPSLTEREKWSEALVALAATRRLSDLSANDFDALFIPGGHGPMVDLVNDAEVQRLVAEFDREGKVIAAVCHGPAALLNAQGEGGGPFVKGKRVTGFTNVEERLALKHKEVPFLLEDALRERGAEFEHALLPFKGHLVEDGNLITGQNPASSKAIAEALLDRLGMGATTGAHP